MPSANQALPFLPSFAEMPGTLSMVPPKGGVVI